MRKVINNCVEPEVGLHIFNCSKQEQQISLFVWGVDGIN